MTATLDENQLVAPCPMCGTLTGLMLAERSALLAVSDVLVYRSLEVVGKRIVRAERRRFKLLGTRPWHEAHTLWLPDANTVEKALSGAWDVVPALLSAHGACGSTPVNVTHALDRYVRLLLRTGQNHTVEALRTELERELGIKFPPEVIDHEHQ